MGGRTRAVARSFAPKGWRCKRMAEAGQQHTTELLIVGAGPAGLAAAVSASARNQSITILDDNPHPGGQIWRGGAQTPHDSQAAEWFKRVSATNTQFINGARIFAQTENKTLLAEAPNGTLALRYQKLILATGARERFLPFPGWTLPNVMGAGGLQALAKSGLDVRGRKVVVAGTGPLLLAVAAHLNSYGADVCLIAEQVSRRRLLQFALGLTAQPSKLREALSLRRQLAGTPYHTSCWPVAADGEKKLERVTL